MKTVGIIQARLGSTRLPGKVLQDLAGKTMLQRVVDRVQRCQTIDQVVIATTDEIVDQPLIEYCRTRDWHVFAGSEHDVLSRYVGAANAFAADRIVRITSDCPLLEPNIVDRTVRLLTRNTGIDYACNFHPDRRFPRGLDCEALTLETLNRLDELATEPRFREHVTLYAYEHASRFTIASISAENDWSHLRWTVDSLADLQLVAAIYRHFGRSDFDWKQIIAAYPANPQWLEINRHCIQKVA